jgi:acetylornithine deacetylase/succinyl-diaminopimelate desuccinylase-like protein
VRVRDEEPRPAPRLTLLVRAYCHLCDEMREALAPVATAAGCSVEEIDVDADPALEARWGGLVPVLLAAGHELCHYRIDRTALAAYLANAALRP